MALCAQCGLTLYGGDELCSHHPYTTNGDQWAEANRIICAFIHRKEEPPRLPVELREELLTTSPEEWASP